MKHFPSVRARFDAAAETYDAAAEIQRAIGEGLAARLETLIASHGGKAPRTIVELGCGTGAFTRRLRMIAPHARIDAYDFSPAMIARARRCGPRDARIVRHVGDGETARFAPSPEWIVGNVVVQWFRDPTAALAFHASQARVVACSLLVEGTFAEWCAAHAQAGVPCGVRALPSYAALRTMLESLGDVRIGCERTQIASRHADGLAFARGLRAIGATMPREGHQSNALRRVLRCLPQPFVATYDVAYVIIERTCPSS